MKILSLEILSNNLTKTEQFYRDVLGLKATEKGNDYISFAAGLTTLTFKFTAHSNPIYHFAFNIPNNQLQEAFKWVENRIEIMDVTPGNKIADFVNWNAKSIYFYDSNGNILEFIARFDLDNKSDAPFSSDSVLCISEIGVATDGVATATDDLINNYNLPVFPRQPRLENFAALGNHDGLLILSSANRHWYPTHKTAQKLHTKLSIESDSDVHCFEFYTNKNGASK